MGRCARVGRQMGEMVGRQMGRDMGLKVGRQVGKKRSLNEHTVADKP